MKTINYTGSSKLIARIVNLLNRKVPLPLDGDGNPDWGTNGQVLSTNGVDGATWVNQGGGGGGGHTIEDADGTDLTQRDTLQFAGYLKADDDSVNSKTVVDDTPTEVQWATWLTMTDAQKAGTKWIIKGVPKSGGTPTSNSVSVVADGVKTYAQLLNSLYALVDTDRIGRNSAVVREVGNSLLVYRLRFINSSHQQIIFDFSGVDIATAGNVAAQTFTIQSAGSTYKVLSAGAYSDNSSAVPTNGTAFVLYYNLMASVGVDTEDSGWQTTAAVNGNTVQYRKIRNQVWVRRGTIGTTSAGSWSNIASLPEGFRPSANVSHAIYAESGGSVYGSVQVLSNGNVNSITNLANNVPAYFFSFLVD